MPRSVENGCEVEESENETKDTDIIRSPENKRIAIKTQRKQDGIQSDDNPMAKKRTKVALRSSSLVDTQNQDEFQDVKSPERYSQMTEDLWSKNKLDLDHCGGKAEKCTRACSSNSVYCLSSFWSFKMKTALRTRIDKLEKKMELEAARDPAEELAGLVNLGNTCYLNSYLQVWFRIPQFRNAIYNVDPKTLDEEGKAKDLIAALKKLFIELQTGPEAVYSPVDIVKILNLDTEQQDALEFGNLFLNFLQDNSKAVGPTVKDIFEGDLQDTMSCLNCQNSRAQTQSFKEISLNIANHRTVTEALNEFFSAEGIDEWRCSKCGALGGKKRVSVSRLPSVINLQLKRFVYDRNSNTKKKIQTGMIYPRKLDMKAFLAEGAVDDDTMYELTAILVHRGKTAYSGHYYANIAGEDSDKWYTFNDETVKKLANARQIPGTDDDHETVKNKAEPRSVEAKGAYMLVYKRRKERQGMRNDGEFQALPAHCDVYAKKLQYEFTKEGDDKKMEDAKALASYEDAYKRLNDLFTDLWIESKAAEEPFELALIPTKTLKAFHEAQAGCIPSLTKKPREKEREFIESSSGEENGLCDSVICLSSSNEAIGGEEDAAITSATESEGRVIQDDIASSLCPHGRVPFLPSCGGEWKAVTIEGAETLRFLYTAAEREESTYRRETDLCRLCCQAYFSQKQKKEKLNETDFPLFQSELKHGQAVSKDPKARKKGSQYYWCSKAYAKIFRRLATSEIERDENEESDVVFNSDLRCTHGGMRLDEKLRFPLHENGWSIVKEYFPSALQFKEDVEECQSCEIEDQEEKALKETRKKLASKYESDIPGLQEKYRLVLNPSGNLENKSYRFLLCRKFYSKLITFIEDRGEGDIPETCNECLLCPHSKLIYPLSPIGGGESNYYPITEDEYMKLFFNDGEQPRTADKLISIQETLDGTIIVDPVVCAECASSLITQEKWEKTNYRNKAIFIQMAVDDEDNDDEAPTTSKRPDSKPLFPVFQTRRSRRTTKSSNADAYIVNSTDTVLLLKLKVMEKTQVMPSDQHLFTSSGVELTDKDMTLEEADVQAESTLRLRVDKPVPKEELMEIAEAARAKTPERGFKGSILSS